jgi:hypothetical protein
MEPLPVIFPIGVVVILGREIDVGELFDLGRFGRVVTGEVILTGPVPG